MSPRVPDPDTVARMHATAAGLTTAGLDTQVHATRGVLDITARSHLPGSKSTEVIVDDDGYVQISYWNAPGATAAQVVAVITAALAEITAATAGVPARVAGSPGR
jgi:hypothetical protein